MSGSRYTSAPTNVQRMIDNIKSKRFTTIKHAKIKALYDTKAKKTKGKYRIGELKLADDFIKYFSEILEEIPYDYVMIFDQALMDEIQKKDTKRVIFHELCHGFKDDNGVYKLVPHDFEGFYEELDYNKDDPDWKLRLSNKLELLHNE